MVLEFPLVSTSPLLCVCLICVCVCVHARVCMHACVCVCLFSVCPSTVCVLLFYHKFVFKLCLIYTINTSPFSISLRLTPLTHTIQCQSPTRAVLLKMAVQRRASNHHQHYPIRSGSVCSLKYSEEAEFSEVRPSSACSRPQQSKLLEKVG